jgi:hypothetical protein
VSIQFGRLRYISRRNGGNAVHTIAYNGRANLKDQRTGERHDWSWKPDKPEHHEIMLADGVDKDYWTLQRLASVVLKELLLALPGEDSVPIADRIELARSFVKEHLVDRGASVVLDVHRPHEVPGAEPGERGNWHSHVSIFTRRIEGRQFADRKLTELEPRMREHGGRSFVAQAERWGELWREHQRQHFEMERLDTIVDPLAIHPGRKSYGPSRRYGPGVEAILHEHRERNTEAARDPERVFEHLRKTGEPFDQRVLDRFVKTHLPDSERAGIREAVMAFVDIASKPTAITPQLRAQNIFSRSFDAILDWIAPRIENERSAEQRSPAVEQPKPSYEQQLRNLADFHRQTGTLRPETEQERGESELYQRYKAERQAAYEAQKAAVNEVYDRFSAYRQDMRSFYNLRYEQEKLPIRRASERHAENEVLKAEKDRDRIEAMELRSQQVAAARAAHQLPDWGSWLAREAEAGDRDAQATLARRQARARERGDQHER